MTRPQSPVQITALGIIALPHSQERHARQHHEPPRALEKSIEPGRTHPIPPAFSPTEFLRRLRSAETLISFNGKIGANLLIPALAAVGRSCARWRSGPNAGPAQLPNAVDERSGPSGSHTGSGACGRLLRRQRGSAVSFAWLMETLQFLPRRYCLIFAKGEV